MGVLGIVAFETLGVLLQHTVGPPPYWLNRKYCGWTSRHWMWSKIPKCFFCTFKFEKWAGHDNHLGTVLQLQNPFICANHRANTPTTYKLPKVQLSSLISYWHPASTCTYSCMHLSKCLLNCSEEIQMAKIHPWSNELGYLGTRPWNVQSVSTSVISIHNKSSEPLFSSMPQTVA